METQMAMCLLPDPSARADMKCIWRGDLELGCLWRNVWEVSPPAASLTTLTWGGGRGRLGSQWGEAVRGSFPWWGGFILKLGTTTLSVGCLLLSPTSPDGTLLGANLLLGRWLSTGEWPAWGPVLHHKMLSPGGPSMSNTQISLALCCGKPTGWCFEKERRGVGGGIP